jgi:hypothetical protein
MPDAGRADELQRRRLALGRQLFRRRRDRGKSQVVLAAALLCDRSTLSRAENHGAIPEDRRFWERVDTELSARGTLLAGFDALIRFQDGVDDTTLPLAAEPAVDRLTLVTDTTLRPPRADRALPGLDAAQLTHHETLTGTYRQIDYQAGARAVAAEVTAHLARLIELGESAPASLRKRHGIAVGDAAQLAAWLAVDRQDYPAARALCGTALLHAAEADASDLHSYVLGISATIHLHTGHGREALDVLRRAIRDAARGPRPAGPALLSWLHEAKAEAHALAGDPAAGAKALLEAERLFESVITAEVPAWLGFYNTPAHLARLRGRCLMRLGDGPAAITALREACAVLPEHFVREQSGTLIDLASAHLLPGVLDPAAAAHTATHAHRLAEATGSARNTSRLRALLPSLHQHRTLPEVRALAGALG